MTRDFLSHLWNKISPSFLFRRVLALVSNPPRRSLSALSDVHDQTPESRLTHPARIAAFGGNPSWVGLGGP
jgi:hypothetical protein